MLKSLGPAALAWNVRTHTTPEPLIPFVPGGRETLTIRLPSASSLCEMKGAGCPSRVSKSPDDTFTSPSFAGS